MRLKRARIAHGFAALAILFCRHHDERVILVEKGGIKRQGIGKERLDLVVSSIVLYKPVAREDTLCISVDDEFRPSGGIKDNGIGGLRTYAVQTEERRAKRLAVRLEKTVEATVVAREKIVCKVLEAFGLDVKIPGAANTPGNKGDIGPVHGLWPQKSCHLQFLDGGLDVRPCGILREYRANYNLETGLRRPPSLRPEGRKHGVKILLQDFRRRGLA